MFFLPFFSIKIVIPRINISPIIKNNPLFVIDQNKSKYLINIHNTNNPNDKLNKDGF